MRSLALWKSSWIWANLPDYPPSEARIEVAARGGLGESNSVGLVRQNGLYVYEYTGSGPTIEIRIEAGIGELNLIVK